MRCNRSMFVNIEMKEMIKGNFNRVINLKRYVWYNTIGIDPLLDYCIICYDFINELNLKVTCTELQMSQQKAEDCLDD